MPTPIISLLLFLFGNLLAFQPASLHTITGQVFDDQHGPVARAHVNERNATNGTYTDSAGFFSLDVSQAQVQLSVSAIGYETKEVTATEGKAVEIRLAKSRHESQEVVVTGYTASRSKARPGRAAGLYIRGLSNGPAPSPSLSSVPRGSADRLGDTLITKDQGSREGYDHIEDNPFLKVRDNPLSTFSIDVDAASYSNVRRMLNAGTLPPPGAVRIEEMINYFTYRYPQPTRDDPFSVNTETAACPWKEGHRLVSIGLQGRELPVENLPPSNLTFLIDVSGSMADEDKLPLVKSSLRLLADQLRPQDRVSIVVYAGQAGLVLLPTPGSDKAAIMASLDRLEAGGSTAGGQGIQLAYRTASRNFMKGGNNRVILCTDGDFNVGQSSDDELEDLIKTEREKGIFLTVLGFGTGNYQDAKMQKLADKGNGNHAYIDNLTEARKVLVREFGATLFTIAKDVKLQIEFNPEKVQGYRLIGYENRLLAKEDFNNDRKDAGELGSGHTVTALYEIIPAGLHTRELDSADALRYQKPPENKDKVRFSGELMNIRLRYKQPSDSSSKLLEHVVPDQQTVIAAGSDNLRFAAAVAEFGMLLRNSSYKGTSSFEQASRLAREAAGPDTEGYRREFMSLLEKAARLHKEITMEEFRDRRPSPRHVPVY